MFEGGQYGGWQCKSGDWRWLKWWLIVINVVVYCVQSGDGQSDGKQ